MNLATKATENQKSLCKIAGGARFVLCIVSRIHHVSAVSFLSLVGCMFAVRIASVLDLCVPFVLHGSAPFAESSALECRLIVALNPPDFCNEVDEARSR